MNFEFEREIGFINSQPSLAECLTSFPAVLESFQTSSIKESTVIPPPFEHTIPSLSPCTAIQPTAAAAGNQQSRRASATNGHPTHHRVAEQPGPPGQAPGPATAAAVAPLAHEFPWMKEKKSSKKCSKTAGGPGGGGSISAPAPSYPSPTAPGYASADIESPTGLYVRGAHAGSGVRVCVEPETSFSTKSFLVFTILHSCMCFSVFARTRVNCCDAVHVYMCASAALHDAAVLCSDSTQHFICISTHTPTHN